MEFKQVVEKRASVRQFAPDPVSADALKEMVRLAGLAPSVNNAQPWKFICVTNKELLKKMAGAVHDKLAVLLPPSGAAQNRNKVEWFSTFFADAPAVIAVVATDYAAVVDGVLPEGLTHAQINEMRGHPDVQSMGGAVEHLLLAAVDQGLGACWLSGPLVAREELEKLLGVGQNYTLGAMVAVGKPAGAAQMKPKKPVEEIIEFRD